MVKGCKGKSYESRPCDERDHCPTTTIQPHTTTTSILASVESKLRRASYQPLSVAKMQKQTDKTLTRHIEIDKATTDNNIGNLLDQNSKV